MKNERRLHRRVKAKKIQADVFPDSCPEQETALNAEILDISRTGIRIKLSEPLNTSMGGKVKITMQLPESGAPFTVHGKLKHQHSDTEYGLHYTDHVEGSVDDMLFECIPLNERMILIKSS